MHILKNKEGKYLRYVDAEFSNGIFWSDKTGENTVDFETEAQAQKFIKDWGFSSSIEIVYLGEGKTVIPPAVAAITFDWLRNQASQHLRQADSNPYTQEGIKSAITHAKFALAMLEAAESKLQGELF